MLTKKQDGCRKIAIIIPSLRGGGAERVMITLGNSFAQKGFSVDLVVLNDKGDLKSAVSSEVKLVNLNSKRAIFSVPALIRYFCRERPQAIFATIVHINIITLIAARFARYKGKIIIRESNVPVTEPRKKLSRRVVHFLAPYVYPMADYIVAVSNGVAAELSQICPKDEDKIVVLPNPVVSQQMLDQADEAIDHRWFQDGSIPVVLAAARLQPHKGFAMLMQAFCEVLKTREANLLILGEGPEKDSLISLSTKLGIQDYVELPGWVLNPFPYMKKADVFVLCSEYEGLPNVLMQAMALGTPSVATNCPSGPAEITQGGALAELIPVGDKVALSKAILAALNSPRRLDAASSMRERFGVDRSSESYLSLLK